MKRRIRTEFLNIEACRSLRRRAEMQADTALIKAAPPSRDEINNLAFYTRPFFWQLESLHCANETTHVPSLTD